jgi:hypothetical protein
MPHWSDPIISAFVDRIQAIDRVLHLSRTGIARLAPMVELVRELVDLERDEDPTGDEGQRRKKIERAEEEASMAKSELGSDFPVLHAQASVALWSALESFVEDLAVAGMASLPDALRHASLASTKIRMADFLAMDDEGRLRFLVSEVSRAPGVSGAAGVTRLEVPLAIVGLSGSIDEKTSRTLFELYHVRNVIVHRGGIADTKFVTACPWFGTSSGARISIGHAKYREFFEAVRKFLMEVITRLVVVRGRTRVDAESLVAKTFQAVGRET